MKPLPSPQRMLFGQGKRRSRAGRAVAIKAAAGTAGLALVSTQCPPSSVSCSRVAPCLRRNPSSACGGAEARGPRSMLLLAGVSANTVAASAIRRGP